MLRIYEIRNKNTHRVEYIDYFVDGTQPDQTFKKTPASKRFANRLDLYVYIKEETFQDTEAAQRFVHQKRMDYKLIKSNIPEPPVHQVESFSFGTNPEDPRSNFKLPEEQKADIFVTETPEQAKDQDLPTEAKAKQRSRKPKSLG